MSALISPVVETANATNPSVPHSRTNGRRRETDQVLRRFEPARNWTSYWRLIHALQRHSTLLQPSAQYNDSSINRIAQACSHLTRYRRHWHRHPECWEGCRSSHHHQWSGFIDHLLHHYPAPAFLASIWLQSQPERWHRELHFHLASGFSVRRFQIPGLGRMGKAAARCFMLAPEDATVAQAVRWAQVVAEGGDANLARNVMTRIPISTHPDGESVWQSVIQFLVRNQPIRSEEVHAIVNFIVEQRFTPARITVGPWMGDLPIAPTINLGGWSLRRMRRWMTNWRTDLPNEMPQPENLRPNRNPWQGAGYQPFKKSDGDAIWQLVELCTANELRIEGGIMKHCVGGYAGYCRRGISSIWSLRCHRGSKMQRIATIEVHPKEHRVVQVKSTSNQSPPHHAMELIREWAKREGIVLLK
ncbi:PcfJ domain-containing protein [Neorhodopirellula lusitana]|nr:PcfJ domain-containing protein [Neorhodopirellula lusitana]